MNKLELTPRGLRIDEFCHRFCIGRTSFWKYATAGHIKTISIGGRKIVPAGEVERIEAEGVPKLSTKDQQAA